MNKKTKASVLALCGVLAALAVGLMFLGGTVAFASIACPVMASLVLIPVYCECGWKWGLVWYGAVSILSLLLAPEKESAILFVFFGYYPMLKTFFGRLHGGKFLKWLVKLLYVNAALCAAYGLMIFVFRMSAVSAEFREYGKWMLAALVALANLTFVVYDILIGRLEIFYFVKLRPKLKL